MDLAFSALLITIIATMQIEAGMQEVEYIFGFPSNFGSSHTYTRIIITTASDSNEKISVSSIDREFFTGHVSAGQPAVVDVPKEMTVFSGWVVDRKKGICVKTSATDLSVVAVSSYNPSDGRRLATTASFKVLPYKKLAAKQYTYHAVTTNSVSEKFSSEILIVAYEDNTNIKIQSPDENILLNLKNDMKKTNDSYNEDRFHYITLDRMQTLLIKDALHDLTGTLISSNNQLAVITGHECGNVPTDQDFCDHLLVQVPPTYSWGKEFLLFPMEGRTAGQNYKVVASHHGTSFSLYCSKHTETNLTLKWKGSFHEFHTASKEHCSLISNKPVLVALLGLGFTADKQGDPSMVLIPPISDFHKKDALFHTLSEAEFKSQYVTIVASSEIPMFYVDEKPIMSFFWEKIPGPNGHNMGYMYTEVLKPKQLNRIVKLTSSGFQFAAFVYGFNNAPRHSYSYSISQDQLSPEDVPVLSLYNGSMVHIENSDMLSIGLGRVDVVDTNLTVKIMITGCSSTTESSLAMPADMPQDFESSHSVGGHSKNLPITEIVTFAPGETDRLIEAIKLVDDDWTEPIKGIRVELYQLDDPIKIMGYKETIISVLDDDVLKLEVTIEDSANSAGSSDDIMINVGVSEGQLLPGKTVPIMLKGSFPRGNLSSFNETMYVSNNSTSFQKRLLRNCSMGSLLQALIELDQDTKESKIPFDIPERELYFDPCARNTLKRPLPPKTNTVFSPTTTTIGSTTTVTTITITSTGTITTTTRVPLQSTPTPSISQESLLLPHSIYPSSVLLRTTSLSFPHVLPAHTTSSFIVSQPLDSSVSMKAMVTSTSTWESSHLISMSSLPQVIPFSLAPSHSHTFSSSLELSLSSSFAPSHSHTFSSSLKLSLASSSSSITSAVSSSTIITNLHFPYTASTVTPFSSSKISSVAASFSLSSSTTTIITSFTERPSLLLQPSSSSAQDALTPTQDQPSSIALNITIPNSHSSNLVKHTRFVVKASPSIASVNEDAEELAFVPILVGVLIAVAVIITSLIAIILVLVKAYRRRKSGSWTPHTPVVFIRTLQGTERSESFEKV